MEGDTAGRSFARRRGYERRRIYSPRVHVSQCPLFTLSRSIYPPRPFTFAPTFRSLMSCTHSVLFKAEQPFSFRN